MQIENVESSLSPSTETNAARFQSAQTVGGELLSAAEVRKIKARASKRAWKIAHPERVKESSRKQYAANKERLLAYARAWQIANKDKVLASGRKWYAANRKEANAKSRAYHAANREKVNETRRKWRAANAEKVKAQGRAWREANLESQREKVRIRYARKRAATIASPIELKAIADWQARVKKLSVATCYWCGKKFNPRKKGSWHLDHINALSKGGSHSAENLCIACPSCNTSKRAKPLTVWSESLPQPMLAI